MESSISAYNKAQTRPFRKICDALAAEIDRGLQTLENKVWHGGPVWFIEGNPIVGYWVRKDSVQLLFWSGQSFKEPGLKREGKFKAAEVSYKDIADISIAPLRRWLKKSRSIQWDYKNIVKRKGELKRLKI